jgi:YD repeat-containing protein
MTKYSRRSFLGGLLAALAAWLGGKARPAQGASPAPPAPPPPQSVTLTCDTLGPVTTCTYDSLGRLLSVQDPLPAFRYDADPFGRTSRPDVDPPGQGPPPGPPGQPPAT